MACAILPGSKDDPHEEIYIDVLVYGIAGYFLGV
jgi:hypothetical protein